MPRTPRLDHPGARHHAMNRTSRKEAIFADDARCSLFVDVLAQVPQRFGARIHGWALMPNHYHMMIEVPRGNLSKVMRFVGATFTQSYNRHMGQDGPVFRGRFHNEIVGDDAYWMHLLAYVHLNAVKAHLARRPEEVLWSSHQAYLHPHLRPDWLTTEELVGLFGSVEALAGYIEDVRLKRRGAPEGFDPDHFFRPPTTTPAPVAPERPVLSATEALDQVARVMGVPRDQVLVRTHAPSASLPFWVAAHWLSVGAGLSQVEIGELLGVSRARVSHLHEKVRSRAVDDVELARVLEVLEEGLSQKI